MASDLEQYLTTMRQCGIEPTVSPPGEPHHHCPTSVNDVRVDADEVISAIIEDNDKTINGNSGYCFIMFFKVSDGSYLSAWVGYS